MQRKRSPWSWKLDEVEERRPRTANMSGPSGNVHPRPDEMPPKDMEFLVPADGVIPLYVQLMNETETLTIDVRRSFITLKLTLYPDCIMKDKI